MLNSDLITISFQNNTWSNISKEITIKKALQEIKDEKYKSIISELRNALENGNDDYYNINKKRLPAVTFCATFKNNRIKANLIKYNNVIVIDIDKLDNEEIIKNYTNLYNDKFIHSFWKSPSNKGYKGLVFLNYNIEFSKYDIDFLHKTAFLKLSKYFDEKYNIILDKSGNDITRLCFMSSDQNIIIKEEFNFFEISENDISFKAENIKTKDSIGIKYVSNRDALFNPKDRNNPYERMLMSNIIKYLSRKKLSITNSYEDWSKVSMALANSFTYDIGLKYFLKLSQLDQEKYNEINATNFLLNAYENQKGLINFSSIIFLANQKNYKTKYQKRSSEEGEAKTSS
ncbi:BT4734/BF3469 family protein [Chryseobacterium gambrini]|uniref:Primase C terminal 2 (PriCT-2) n=1 Tax=Chryseobacterium gambrini TaxID=373672 RepID=A0A1N7PEA9_9FLAO|nr:BT4734/BF3469 family protein [Chryseobacterium gambrini]SIT08952.1 Primase C terminal 2 (PriCT-2) [Chryseobacterium gambrini]